MAEQKNSNLRLRDIFAATPLGVKGRETLLRLGVKMTPDEFVDKLYVEPLIYIKKNNLPDGDRNYGEDYDSETEPNELVKIGYDRKKFERLMHEKGEFEELFYGLDKSLYLIKGSAGCGKTTYYYNLMRALKKDERNIDFYFCDLVESLSSFIFLNKREEFDRKNNVWIFIGYILNKILHPIFFNKTSDNHNKFIKNVVAIYKKYIDISGDNAISDDIRQVGIFEELEKLANTNSRQEFFNAFGEYIINKINEFKNNDKEEGENEIEAVEFAMGLVIRIFFCLSKMEREEKKYVCAIDSVEYYIHYNGEKRLQNVEIARIIVGIKNAADTMQKKIEQIKKIDDDYKTFYGIVIMMRDTSETIIEDNDQNEERSYKYSFSIDISEWFDAKSITESRERFFEEMLTDCQIAKNTFDNVMSDTSLYRWGMHNWLARMYNYNKRSIIDCLGEALSRKSNEELEWFNTKWEEAITKKSDVLKYICRQYIFRIMLDYVQEINYFDKVMAATNGKFTPETTSYARRITTTLHNWALQHGRKFASFSYIIESVLVKYEGIKPTDEDINNLSDILYIMNQPNVDRIQDNIHWTALVEIKFDPKGSPIYTENTLFEALLDEWNKKKGKEEAVHYSTKNYGIRIRTSGQFFLDMLPEFEHFSCRSVFNQKKKTLYPPLFELANLEKIDGEYFCITIIRDVYDKTIKCIEEIIERERYSTIYKNNWLYRYKNYFSLAQIHPVRIFKQHIGYLENYCEYIKDYTGKKCNQSDKREIVSNISNIIDLYRKKLVEFEKDNRYYFHPEKHD